MRDTIHVNCQRSDVVRKWKNRYPRLVSSYLVINEARDRVAKRRKNGRDGSAVKQQVAQRKGKGERDGRPRYYATLCSPDLAYERFARSTIVRDAVMVCTRPLI